MTARKRFERRNEDVEAMEILDDEAGAMDQLRAAPDEIAGEEPSQPGIDPEQAGEEEDGGALPIGGDSPIEAPDDMDLRRTHGRRLSPLVTKGV